ncbi:MAG: DbpA RNA binding domain-containing protein [Ruminococcus sp.]|nr:DbpA RNA binding domain-containing protein [Ruminococcus sp.]
MTGRDLGFLGKLTDEERFFVGSVYDKIYAAREKYRTGYTFFLTERQAELARKAAASECFERCLLFGGYDGAERLMLGAFSEYDEPETSSFPIAALTFRFRREDKLTHRDILGALMGLDIARETVGDISVGESCAVVFLTETVAEQALMGISKIGRAGVKVERGFDPAEIPAREYQLISGTVSSPRLDSVIALAVRCSRSHAAALVEGGKVILRGQEVTSCSVQVSEGDVFTVRGQGKFRLGTKGRMTKKDRTFIEIYKYK